MLWKVNTENQVSVNQASVNQVSANHVYANHVYALLKSYLSPSLRFELKQHIYRTKHFCAALCFWQWQRSKFPFNANNTITINYLGRPQNKRILMSLLGVDAANINQPNTSLANTKANEVSVTQYPMRDAICIPFSLVTIVALRRPIETIVASYSKSLRRSINAERPNYRHKAINDIAKIDEIERDMLKAYATARHDNGAAQLEPGLVAKLAQPRYGRLDLLLHNDEPVGCHLGNFYTRKGKCYWHVNRLGYPQHIFSDYKHWGEVNSMNLHLALESAIENGYDYCDYGVSLAKPGHGLIEWKRRRKGFLATHDNFKFFYMKLPKSGGAQFLWHIPVFGVESGKPTLHLGIPADKTDAELLERYHEMGYAGLYKVYLDCVTAPSAHFIESIRALYADQQTQPLVITYIVG